MKIEKIYANAEFYGNNPETLKLSKLLFSAYNLAIYNPLFADNIIFLIEQYEDQQVSYIYHSFLEDLNSEIQYLLKNGIAVTDWRKEEIKDALYYYALFHLTEDE